MHNWAGHRTGVAAGHQVVHRGSAADAGSAWGAVAALRFDGPTRGP